MAINMTIFVWKDLHNKINQLSEYYTYKIRRIFHFNYLNMLIVFSFFLHDIEWGVNFFIDYHYFL